MADGIFKRAEIETLRIDGGASGSSVFGASTTYGRGFVKRSLDAAQRTNAYGRTPEVPVGFQPPAITLTEDQEAAVRALEEFEASSDPFFLLAGFAGTGKTTVLNSWLRKRGSRGVAFCAPTNKATRVLFEMATRHGLSVPCLTIHKLLRLRVMKDASKKYAARAAASADRVDIGDFDIVVIDECSMVGDKPPPTERVDMRGLYELATSEAKKAGTKIIFVGDPAQLPPIEEGQSRTFETPRRIGLTKVVRQALDNPIIAVATYIRAKMYGEEVGTPPSLEAMADGVGVMRYARKDWLDKIVAAYREDADHPTRFKVLAAHKANVDDLNNHVRRALFGEDVPPFRVGERYIATEPVAIFEGEECVGFAISTDEDATILSAERAPHPRFPEYDAWRLEMQSDNGTFECHVVDPKDRRRWEEEIEAIGVREARGKRRFWMKWELNDAFAHLRPHYAMTIHRSQGSTYEEVFVDVQDIDSWRDQWTMYRLLYTACTRPSRALHLVM